MGYRDKMVKGALNDVRDTGGEGETRNKGKK